MMKNNSYIALNKEISCPDPVILKPGMCPYNYMCPDNNTYCKVDKDCYGNMKCCDSGCMEPICVTPDPEPGGK